MTSNQKKPPPPRSPDFADTKAKKRSRIIGRIIRYTIYTIFVAMWAMVGFLGYIAIVDVAVKTELISTTSLAVKYKTLVALVLMWVSSIWVLKIILPKTLESKPFQSPLSVPPQFTNVEILRERIIRHGIYAIACILVAFFACIAIVNLAGKSTTITIQIPTLLTSNVTIQLPDLSTNSTSLIAWIALGVAVLINIAIRPTTRKLFFEALSGIWKLVKNLSGF